MSEAALEKILRLVALSGSENPHEAQNAAVHACRLIREGIQAKTIMLSTPSTVSPAVQRARDNVEAAMRSQGKGGEWVDAPIRGSRKEEKAAWEAFKKRGYK